MTTATLSARVRLQPAQDPPFILRRGQYAAVLVDPQTGNHIRTLCIATQKPDQPTGYAHGRAIAAIHRAWETGQVSKADEIALYGADEGGQISWFLANS